MNVAIVGLGNIGFGYDKSKKDKFHSLSKSFNKSKFFNLKIAIEKKKRTRDEFKKKFPSVKVFKEISSLKKKQIDFIIISTPTIKHYYSINQIFKNLKKPMLLIEKPISNNYDEFKKVLSILKSKNIIAFINYQRQSHPIFLDLSKKLVNSKTTDILVKYSKGIYNNASHYLTYLLSVYGKTVKIIKTQNLKKINNDYLINFDLKFDKSYVRFRYTAKTNQMVCNNNKIYFLTNRNKIVYTINGKNVYKKEKISQMFNNYQFNVINNLEKFYNKKKFNLCKLDKNYKTESIINSIINFKNV